MNENARRMKTADEVLTFDVPHSDFLPYPAGRDELYEIFMTNLKINTTGSWEKMEIGGKTRIIKDTTNPKVFVIEESVPSVDGGQTRTRQIVFVGSSRTIDEFEY